MQRDEAAARTAVFDWLQRRIASGDEELTRAELEAFTFQGERLPLLDQSRGIRNPAWFTSTLSVMTSSDGPYADEPTESGFIRYDYRTGDGGDNRKLRAAAELNAPIVYFRRVRPNVFLADFPAYVVADLTDERAVLLALGDDVRLFGAPAALTTDQRSYAERMTRQRLHQPLFRSKVMHAYQRRCAVCSLRHVDLLDAAHIIPDADERGTPVVSNGVALCKIHHAAYDRNFLGLSPDYMVHINERLMVEVDGPMLQYGLQAMDGRPLEVPARSHERPDRDALAVRFAEFASSRR